MSHASALRQIPIAVLNSSKPEYLSHSAATLYQTCPRKYQNRYKLRLGSAETSINLGFGSAIDEGASAHIVGHAMGQYVDSRPVFEQAFERFCSTNVVAYSTKFQNKEDVLAMGRLLLQRFEAKWKELGYIALLDPQGKPLVQIELKVTLPTNIIFTAILDVIVMTPDNKVLVVDIKTPSQASSEAFLELSDQLTGYQLVVEAHKERLGIDHLDGVAFLELIKRPIPKKTGMGPEVLTPVVCNLRPKDKLEDFVQSRVWIAEDIRRERFPTRSLDSYSTPCDDTCEFVRQCRFGSKDGLVVRPQRQRDAPSEQTTLAIA
jgi:hypothetical protein